MSQIVSGTVSEVSSRPWEEDGEEFNLYSFRLRQGGPWYRTGREDPRLNEGDNIRFALTRANNVDLDSIEDVSAEEAEANAPKQERRSSNRSGGNTRNYRGGGSGGARRSAPRSPGRAPAAAPKPAAKENWDARAKYWDDKEKRDIQVVEPRINYSASQRDAIALVTAALAHDCIVFGNAAKGAKLDMLLEAVDRVTERFYIQRVSAEYVGLENQGVSNEEDRDIEE